MAPATEAHSITQEGQQLLDPTHIHWVAVPLQGKLDFTSKFSLLQTDCMPQGERSFPPPLPSLSHHRLSPKCQRRTFKDRVSVDPFTSPIRCLSWIPSPYPPERRQPCLPSWRIRTEDPKPVAGHSFPGLVPSPPIPSEDLSCSRLEFPQSTPALGCAVPKQL